MSLFYRTSQQNPSVYDVV